MSYIVKTIEEMVPTLVKRDGIRCDNPTCMGVNEHMVAYESTDLKTGTEKKIPGNWLQLSQYKSDIHLHFCSPKCAVNWLQNYYAKALHID